MHGKHLATEALAVCIPAGNHLSLSRVTESYLYLWHGSTRTYSGVYTRSVASFLTVLFRMIPAIE